MLDATNTDYIDPDVLSLIRDFRDSTAPRHNVIVSLRGFKNKYSLNDETQFIDYSTRELQQDLKPDEVLQILQEGNQRFQAGQPLFRDYTTQLTTAGQGQFPFAVILSCIDSCGAGGNDSRFGTRRCIQYSHRRKCRWSQGTRQLGI